MRETYYLGTQMLVRWIVRAGVPVLQQRILVAQSAPMMSDAPGTPVLTEEWRDVPMVSPQVVTDSA